MEKTPDIVKEAFCIVECAATHNKDTCIRCGKGCDIINALFLVRDYVYNTDIEAEAERMYNNKEYSCHGLFCTVATTNYEPDEQKRICIDCIKEKYFGNPNKPLYKGFKE